MAVASSGRRRLALIVSGGVLAPLFVASACGVDNRTPGTADETPSSNGPMTGAPDSQAAALSPAPGSGASVDAGSPTASGAAGSSSGAAESSAASQGAQPPVSGVACEGTACPASMAPAQNPAPASTPAAPDQPAATPVVVSIFFGTNGAHGRVTSTPAGLDCSSAPCSASFPTGTHVVLHSFTDTTSGFGFAGWSAGPCSGLDDCEFTLGGDTGLTASYAPANLVFVTSTAAAGDFGGLAGGDAICAARARAAGFAGNFSAWLSTSTVDAIDRLAGSRGWVRPDHKPVVDSQGALAKGLLFFPIRINELGGDDASTRVRTATGPDGRSQANLGLSTCSDFTVADTTNFVESGFAVGLGAEFTSTGSNVCQNALPLYCFGTGSAVAIRPDPVAGRVAFASSPFLVGSGIAGADALCQSNASAAGLAGTFKAVLPTSTASAGSRFDTSGAPWVRPDGIRITETAAEFFTSPLWDSAPNLAADGSLQASNKPIWFGATGLDVVAPLASTCNDWTSTTGTVATDGRSNGTSATDYFQLFSNVVPCNNTLTSVACLQL
jgi:hypothetical protein